MLFLFLLFLGVRGTSVMAYIRRKPRPAPVVSHEPPPQTFFHRCAQCGKTEITAPDLEFRVSRNGEEYCFPHLPKGV